MTIDPVRSSLAPQTLRDLPTASPVMAQLLALAERVVDADTTLLVLGETGVGKEWLARAIHAQSPRASAPFTAVNCAAMPATLLESELFGHEKGAFTGAERARRGYFELAHRGVLFLDEIGELAAPLQAKLLRALQERRVQRIGSEVPIDVDVRLMAATSRNLELAMAQGEFRPDLYYRLGVVTLVVPPLRERAEDIPLLVERYLAHFGARMNRPARRVSAEAMRALERYSWPGNIRELVNVIERVVLLGSTEEIALSQLPAAVAAAAGRGRGEPAEGRAEWVEALYGRPLDEAREVVVDRFEAEYLRRLLAATRGQVGETARRAGLGVRTLYNKMRRLGLDKADFREG